MSEKCKDRFVSKINISSRIIRPDRADLTRSRLRAGGREQPSVGTSATGHGLHGAERATGLTGTQNGGSLEDGAERIDGSMHREGSMHESRPEQQQTFLNRAVPWVGFKDYTQEYILFFSKNEDE